MQSSEWKRVRTYNETYTNETKGNNIWTSTWNYDYKSVANKWEHVLFRQKVSSRALILKLKNVFEKGLDRALTHQVQNSKRVQAYNNG